MRRRRRRKCLRWRPGGPVSGFTREQHNAGPYPFGELNYCQQKFLDVLGASSASPRAAVREALRSPGSRRRRFIEWLDHPAFFAAMALSLNRRFGRERADRMLSVLYRFMLSRPFADVIECGRIERPILSEDK